MAFLFSNCTTAMPYSSYAKYSPQYIYYRKAN